MNNQIKLNTNNQTNKTIKGLFSLLVFAALYLGVSWNAESAIITSTSIGGTWGSSSTWVGGKKPKNSDVVVIATSGVNEVIIGATATCAGVTINSGAILKLTTFGLSVNGTWVNNGILIAGTSTITFGGSNAAINAGTGTGNFYGIATNKSATTLNINRATTSSSLKFDISTGNLTVNINAITVVGTLTYGITEDNNINQVIYIASGIKLSVTGALTIPRANDGINTLNVGSGILEAGSISFTECGNTVRHKITISTGRVSVFGNISQDNSGTSGSIIFLGAGTLNAGAAVFNTSWVGTLTTYAGSTVNYNGAAQTIYPINYLGNLILSGSGTKTLSAARTISSNLTISGTAVASFTGNSFAATLTLSSYGKMNGTWGSTYSSATNKTNAYFTSSGTITVTTDTRPNITVTATGPLKTYGTALTTAISTTNFNVIGSLVGGDTVTNVTLTPDLAGLSANTAASAPYVVNPSLAIGTGGFIASNYKITCTAFNGTVSASTNNWTGGTGNWNTADNWSLNRVPSSLNDNITIVTGTPSLDINYTVGIGRTLTISGTGGLNINPNYSISIAGTANFGGKPVIVKSDVSGTGAIGQITGTLNEASNITVERYIPASGRKYRFLSSPVVGGTTLQWRDNASNTSGRGTQITGTGTVDVSLTNAPSAFYYSETNTTGTINDAAKWTTVDGNSSLTNGKGYRVIVRGNRSISLITLNSVNNATTIWVKGTHPTGVISLPVTYTPTGGNGWNLVGNPYPCSIDYIASLGWTKTNMGTGISTYRPSTNSYAYSITSGDITDNVTVSINGGSNIIGSGMAFWVRATGSNPILSCTESVKVTSAPPTLLLKTLPSNQIKIKLTQDTSNMDETVIVFGENFNDHFIETEDVNKLVNSTVNISSIVGVEKYAAINFTSNNYSEKTIPLSVWGNTNGKYQLAITQIAGFDPLITIFLRDKFLNTLTFINQDKQFNVDLADNSKGDNLFELLFKNSVTNTTDVLVSNTQLKVYPNPAADVLNISFSNGLSIETVNIYNVSGKLVNNNKLNGNQIDISQLTNGVYLLEVLTAKGIYNTKFVK